MVKVKHFLEAVESSDGQRVWAEPVGLTKDLCEWCRVDHVLSNFGPPRKLWDWFMEHPDGYEHFRGEYHTHLAKEPYRSALLRMACAAMKEDFTLLHQGDDPQHNTATALYEFISELEAYCPRDES